MLLPDLLDKNIENFGEYPFLYFGEKEYTNLETLHFANQLANALRNWGVAAGDRVLVCMPNCPEVLVSYQGITRAGAVIVPVLYVLHAQEIGYIIRNSEAKAVITSSHVLDKVQEACSNVPSPPKILVVDRPGDEHTTNFYDLIQDEPAFLAHPPENLTADDVAVILYTSGTTGKPKGVMLTHKNLYSNAANSASINQREPGVTLGVLPLAHVYGLTVSNVCYLTGSSIVVFPKFDPAAVFEAIEKHRVQSFSAVPAMLHAMIHHPHASRYDLSSLEYVGSGSASLPLTIIDAFKQKFGADVYEGYGLSEAAPVVTAYREGMEYKPGSVGIPIPGVEIQVVDDAGNALPPGEVGELIVRGDNVTPGYHNNEEASRSALKDGWLYTGDLAKIDEDGYLYIVDRKKDLIIHGGFNIYPRDVEELLLRHPAVLDAAVIGVPAEGLGEDVAAFVVLKSGQSVNDVKLILYCQEYLAKYKTPRYVYFVDALPRNGVGKILKMKLRQMAADEYGI